MLRTAEPFRQRIAQPQIDFTVFLDINEAFQVRRLRTCVRAVLVRIEIDAVRVLTL